MRNKIFMILCFSLISISVIGCGNKSTDNTTLESYDENSSKSESEDNSAAYDFGYQASDYVSMGDYSSVKIDDVEAEEITDNDVLNEIKNRTTSTLTDDLVSELSNGTYTTVDDYKSFIRSELEDEAQYNRYQKMYLELLDSIDVSYDSIPDEEKSEELTIEDMQKEAEKQGIDLSDLLDQYRSEGKFDSDDSEIYFNLTTLYIAQKEGIEVTENEINEYCEDKISDGQYDSVEKIKEAYTERAIAHEILNNKVFSFLFELQAENRGQL